MAFSTRTGQPVQILRSKYFLVFLVTLLIEQAIVASSTYWIAQLTIAITTSQPFEPWLILFLLSLTLVYVPTSAKNYALGAAKFVAHRRFVCGFSENFRNHAKLARSQKLRSERHPFVVSEAWLVVEEFFDYVSLFSGLTVNVLLGVAVLGLAVSPFIVLAYALSLPVLALSLRFSAPPLDRAARAAQSSRSALTQNLVGAWDAVLIGNKLNYDLWKTDFLDRHKRFKKDGLHALIITECMAALSMAVSLLPLFAAIVWAFFHKNTTVPGLAVAAATLPRQIQTIQNLGDCIVIATRWPSVRAKIQVLVSALDLPATLEEYTGAIRWNQIRILTPEGRIVNLADSGLDQLDNLMPNGRWTIRGPNGSGKTTFLATLKEKLGQRALFLPAVTDMPFLSIAHTSLSTGERVIAILSEVVDQHDIDTLLLDEWDANLDGEMLLRASVMIDRFARDRRVIEVRHRADEVTTNLGI